MKLKNIVRSDHCLNCNTVLQQDTNFCPHCGQLNNTKKETAAGLLRELAEDFLHLDNKVMGSLFPLLFKPGRLTKEYNAGRRARYLHPVRLFISVTIIMLIITSISGNDNLSFNANPKSADSTEVSGSKSTFTINIGDSVLMYNDIKQKVDSGIVDPKQLLEEFKIENTAYNRFIMQKAVKVGKMSWREIALYIKSKLPWILFALMPVFALIMYLVFWSKKLWFADHLIYSFHLHSATFIIISLNSLLSWIFPFLGSSILLYIPFYYFISLKKVYDHTWLKSILKGVLGGILYLIAGIFFVGITIAVLFAAI